MLFRFQKHIYMLTCIFSIIRKVQCVLFCCAHLYQTGLAHQGVDCPWTLGYNTSLQGINLHDPCGGKYRHFLDPPWQPWRSRPVPPSSSLAVCICFRVLPRCWLLSATKSLSFLCLASLIKFLNINLTIIYLSHLQLAWANRNSEFWSHGGIL